MRRIATIAAVATGLIVSVAAPAMADPAVPTNYRSEVLLVEPANDVVRVSVLGGDAFLDVTVESGHDALVLGYAKEPYIRFDADGSVWVNDRSPARWVNEDRYAAVDIPDSADAAAEPAWRQVSDGGSYAWHDHRTHWMSPSLPPNVGGGERQLIFPWSVIVEVDGIETRISGELFWFPSTSPWAALLIGLAIAVALSVAWRRSPGHAAAALIGIGFIAGAVGIAQWLATPVDRTVTIGLLGPAAAIVAATAGLAISRRPVEGPGAISLAGLMLTIWALGVIGALTAPILPSGLPAIFERGAVAAALLGGLTAFGAGAFEVVRVVNGNTRSLT